MAKSNAKKSKSIETWTAPSPTELRDSFVKSKKQAEVDKEFLSVCSKIESEMVSQFIEFTKTSISEGATPSWWEYKFKSNLLFLSSKDEEYLAKIKEKVQIHWAGYGISVSRKLDLYTIRLSW